MREISERQRRDLKQRTVKKTPPGRLKPWVGKLSVEIVKVCTKRCGVPVEEYPNLKIWVRKLGTASVRRFTLRTRWHSIDRRERLRDITRYLFLAMRLHIVTIEQKHKQLTADDFSEYLKKLLVGAQLDMWTDFYHDSNSYDLSSGERREVHKGDIFLRELRPLGSYGADNTRYASRGQWSAKDKHFRQLAREQTEIDTRLQEEADGGHLAEPQIEVPLPAVEVELPEFEDDRE